MIADLAGLPDTVHNLLALTLGLLVGSFLNVVIYRYPRMLQYQWSKQSFEWLHQDQEYAEQEPDGIASPGSRCGNCGSAVKAWQNIPLISYMLLGGKCANCKQSIGLRYPLVELLTGLLSAGVMAHFGWSWQAAAGLLLSWTLVTLAFIDYDHKLLPDDIVLPVMWLGLGLSLVPVFAAPGDAIIGAIAGYLALWVVYQLFKRLTGKEGMGYGDFKLLALLGAWLGWQYLPQIILVSTVLGSVIGLSMIALRKHDAKQAIPFGPFIAIAGWVALIWGAEINAAYMNYSGF